MRAGLFLPIMLAVTLFKKTKSAFNEYLGSRKETLEFFSLMAFLGIAVTPFFLAAPLVFAAKVGSDMVSKSRYAYIKDYFSQKLGFLKTFKSFLHELWERYEGSHILVKIFMFIGLVQSPLLSIVAFAIYNVGLHAYAKHSEKVVKMVEKKFPLLFKRAKTIYGKVKSLVDTVLPLYKGSALLVSLAFAVGVVFNPVLAFVVVGIAKVVEVVFGSQQGPKQDYFASEESQDVVLSDVDKSHEMERGATAELSESLSCEVADDVAKSEDAPVFPRVLSASSEKDSASTDAESLDAEDSDQSMRPS